MNKFSKLLSGGFKWAFFVYKKTRMNIHNNMYSYPLTGFLYQKNFFQAIEYYNDYVGTEYIMRQVQELLHGMFCFKPTSYNNHTKYIIRPQHFDFLDCTYILLELCDN